MPSETNPFFCYQVVGVLLPAHSRPEGDLARAALEDQEAWSWPPKRQPAGPFKISSDFPQEKAAAGAVVGSDSRQ